MNVTTSATILQMPLFTRPAPRVSTASVDMHAVSRPARTFTGDFYFTHRHAERLWLAVGDVAGKGLPAALVMAMIQEELEHRIACCAATACDPSATMSRLHAFLRPVIPRNRFATAVIGHLHDDGTLTITNAGHCPPLIVRADGRIEELDSTGPAVGILPAPEWRSTSVHLRKGETLLLYSDGLLEARSESEEEFGMGRIRRTLARTAALPTTRAVANAILEEVNRHDGGRREDDLTIVVVRR